MLKEAIINFYDGSSKTEPVDACLAVKLSDIPKIKVLFESKIDIKEDLVLVKLLFTSVVRREQISEPFPDYDMSSIEEIEQGSSRYEIKN